MTERLMLIVIQSYEDENFLAYCPEWRGAFEAAKNKFENLVQLLEEEHLQANGIEDIQDFSKFVKASKFGNLHWEKRKNKPASEILRGLRIQNLEKLMKKILNYRVQAGLKRYNYGLEDNIVDVKVKKEESKEIDVKIQQKEPEREEVEIVKEETNIKDVESQNEDLKIP